MVRTRSLSRREISTDEISPIPTTSRPKATPIKSPNFNIINPDTPKIKKSVVSKITKENDTVGRQLNSLLSISKDSPVKGILKAKRPNLSSISKISKEKVAFEIHPSNEKSTNEKIDIEAAPLILNIEKIPKSTVVTQISDSVAKVVTNVPNDGKMDDDVVAKVVSEVSKDGKRVESSVDGNKSNAISIMEISTHDTDEILRQTISNDKMLTSDTRVFLNTNFSNNDKETGENDSENEADFSCNFGYFVPSENYNITTNGSTCNNEETVNFTMSKASSFINTKIFQNNF